MGAPVLIGAGIGAATSLAMGRSPLQGALLGGIGGGAFGGSGGFGSGFTEGGLFGSGGLFESALPAATEGVKSGVQLGVDPSLAAEGSLLDLGGSLSTDLSPVVSSPEGLGTSYLDYSIGSPIMGSYGEPVGVNLSKGFTPFAENVGVKGVQLDVAPLPDNIMDISTKNMINPETVTSLGAPVSSGMPEPSFFNKAYDKFSTYLRDNPAQLLQGGLIAGSLLNSEPDMPVQGSSGGTIKQGDPSLVKGYDVGSGLNLGVNSENIAVKIAMTTVPKKKRQYSIG
jgi:hypothetical protein